jgi:DNA-binding response OmpR family regulator
LVRVRLLAVDDDEALQRYLIRALQPEVEVAIAPSIARAFDAIDRGERYDVVLLDLHIPHENAVEGYRSLVARGCTVIIMTGGALEPSEAELLDALPDVVLWKPFTKPELLAMIERARTLH